MFNTNQFTFVFFVAVILDGPFKTSFSGTKWYCVIPIDIPGTLSVLCLVKQLSGLRSAWVEYVLVPNKLVLQVLVNIAECQGGHPN